MSLQFTGTLPSTWRIFPLFRSTCTSVLAGSAFWPDIPQTIDSAVSSVLLRAWRYVLLPSSNSTLWSAPALRTGTPSKLPVSPEPTSKARPAVASIFMVAIGIQPEGEAGRRGRHSDPSIPRRRGYYYYYYYYYLQVLLNLVVVAIVLKFSFI
eukprot:SAG31_NODE_2185_length_6243_cov_3.811035_5_plen_153_part_00